MNISNKRIGVGILGVAAVVGATGCGGTLDPDETVQSESQGLTTADFTDFSGTVQVRVKTCDWTPSQTINCAYCAVDAGWVRVGGGAEIENSPNARLRGSFPANYGIPPTNNTEPCTGNGTGDYRSGWVARSFGPDAHRLRAYVVGLKLSGLSSGDLIGEVSTTENTTSSATVLQSLTVQTLSGVLIGVGAEVVPGNLLPTLGNGFLTESRPADGFDWVGSVTYKNPPDGQIKVYAIGIDPCPSGWIPPGATSPQCLDMVTRSATSSSGTGYRTAADATPSLFATTAVGGIGKNGTTGRYLSDLIPLNGSAEGFSVSTNDVGGSSSGTATGTSLSYFLHGTLSFNMIRTSTLTFSRGSTNLVQGTLVVPPPAANQWYLEPFPYNSGYYRLRNQDPGTNGVCAQRNSTNIVIAACGTGNDFQWSLAGGSFPGNFLLKNRQSGTCIDTNGKTTSGSALTLKTCSPSDAQWLLADNWNWPM